MTKLTAERDTRHVHGENRVSSLKISKKKNEEKATANLASKHYRICPDLLTVPVNSTLTETFPSKPVRDYYPSLAIARFSYFNYFSVNFFNPLSSM